MERQINGKMDEWTDRQIPGSDISSILLLTIENEIVECISFQTRIFLSSKQYVNNLSCNRIR